MGGAKRICESAGTGRQAGLRCLCLIYRRVGSSPISRTTSEQDSYRLLRLFSKVRAHSRRCSSFPTATRRASVSDIAATRWSLTDVACPLRVLCWARSWRAALRAAFTLGLYLFRQRMAKRKIRREVCLSFWVLAAEGVLHSFDFKCSGEMNSPCAEVLPAAKRSYGANAPPRRAGPQPMSASLSSMHGTPEQAICACSGFSKGDACAYLAAAPFRDAAGYFFPEFCGAQRAGT